VIIGIIVGLVVLLLLVGAGLSARIVREYQRVMLFRLGNARGLRGPGLVLINPITDRTILVDLREQYLEIPQQTAITRDNAPISIDFIIFYKVVDPEMTVLKVQNFAGAALNVAATTLRSVVGDMPLDELLSKRDEMNSALRVRLDDVTEPWGVKVTNVEVREVNPPNSVQQEMIRQMSAERSRRAQVTEAEGQKQAAILAAEGERQAAINVAEGRKQAAILAAEGERQASVLRAEGYSAGLDRIRTVAEDLDDNTLLLQYLDTLKQVGSSPSTKLVVPMELGSLLSGLRGLIPAEAPGRAGQERRPAPGLGGRPPALAEVDNGARVEPNGVGPAAIAAAAGDGAAVEAPVVTTDEAPVVTPDEAPLVTTDEAPAERADEVPTEAAGESSS
jgi:regulator of protease activity HflC (stomatin/prohibitin superfamily)